MANRQKSMLSQELVCYLKKIVYYLQILFGDMEEKMYFCKNLGKKSFFNLRT